MKYQCLLLFMLIFTFANAQQANTTSDRELYQKKINRYTKVRNVGSIFLVSGVCFVGGGSYLLMDLNRKRNSQHHEWSETDETLSVIAPIALIAGIESTIAGIIIHSSGNRNIRKYQKKLDNISFTPIYTPTQKGLYLSCNF